MRFLISAYVCVTIKRSDEPSSGEVLIHVLHLDRNPDIDKRHELDKYCAVRRGLKGSVL